MSLNSRLPCIALRLTAFVCHLRIHDKGTRLGVTLSVTDLENGKPPRLVSAVRKARLAVRLLRANVQRLETPVKVNLCVTYWCQYKCQTCNIWKRTPTDELTTDELLLFVRKNPHIAWLDLTGGEIFLREDIGDVLEAIVRSWKRLAVLHFPTNGFLTDRIRQVTERVARQSTADLIVTVSLDGDELLNDEVRGIAGGYRRQVATFNALRRIPGVRVVFGMTLSHLNAGQFEATFAACQRDCPGLTIADFHLNLAQVSEHYYGNEEMSATLIPREEAKEDLRRYRAKRGIPTSVSAWVEHRFLTRMNGFLDTGRTPMRCHALRSSCFIDPWGVVYPCISYSRTVGRLREHQMDLEAVWRAATTQALQAEIWAGRCPQCWTACEAYQSILGNLVRSDASGG